MKQPKKAKPTLFLTPPTENPVPTSKMFFFSGQTRRLQESFKGSYSSLAYSNGELSRVIASCGAASGRLMHFLILVVKCFFGP